ncbi:MAG: type II toxin-antitoxin system HicB family antitoxin [Firmicutes bacterium]|nr:type II toxin-antitoxin system HicB family antitoxin [Bacillota bacterium]
MNKYRYEIIIYWSDADNCYIAEVPELAGCMSDGASYSDCLSNLEVIIDEWLETAKELGRTIPVPKSKKIIDTQFA